jgi:hypothetical protein
MRTRREDILPGGRGHLRAGDVDPAHRTRARAAAGSAAAAADVPGEVDETMAGAARPLDITETEVAQVPGGCSGMSSLS